MWDEIIFSVNIVILFDLLKVNATVVITNHSEYIKAKYPVIKILIVLYFSRN